MRELWDSDEAMQLNISMKMCTMIHTWPGTTALENSLFSWTSSLGVVSNFSAMLFNVSRDSTWTTKQERTYNITLLLKGYFHEAVLGRLEDVAEMMRGWKKAFTLKLITWFMHVRFWDALKIKAANCWPGIDSHGDTENQHERQQQFIIF